MNKSVLILIIISFFSCQKEESNLDFQPLLDEFNNSKTQEHIFLFKLDTVVVTEKRNKIYLVKDDFVKMENDTIKVSIVEYFDKSDLILNNIRTVTDRGEPLESKGVFKVDISCNNTPLKLKNDRKIRMDLIKQDYRNYKVYISTLDSLNQINWIEDGEIFVPVQTSSRYGTIESLISIDSLDYYKKKNKSIERSDNITLNESIELNPIHSIFFTNNELTNIDKLLIVPIKKDLKFEIKSHFYDNHFVYIIYPNVNSFASYSIWGDNLELKSVPLLNDTKLIFVSFKSYDANSILYDEILINEDVDSNIIVDLKEIQLEDFKEVLTSY